MFLANTIIPDALSKSGISSVLISCKEDNPPQLRQVDLDFNDQIKSRLPLVETCSTSANVPESQKRCISLILRSILKGRRGKLCWHSSNQSCIPIFVVAHFTRHNRLNFPGN
jgi:hypothetical protein